MSWPSNATMNDVPEDLRTLVEQALAEGRRQLSNRGGIDPVFLVRLPDGRIQRADIPAPLNELMNYGEGKSHIFSFVRAWVRQHSATATVFMTDAWVGLPTEKQKQMARENRAELERIVGQPGFNLDEGERLGLMERSEALILNVQTEQDVVIVEQSYTRYQEESRVEFSGRRISRFPQAGFRGRQKMYGVKSDADIV